MQQVETVELFMRRAREERIRADQARTPEAKAAHLMLADLHQQKALTFPEAAMAAARS